MDREIASNHVSNLRYERLTGKLGAEVSGINLTRSIDHDIIAALTAALVEHKVLFFRNQPMTTAQHLEFAAHFGKSEPYALGELGALTFHPQYPDVAVLDSIPGKAPSRADVWHSDLTFQQAPSFGSILRCVIAPEFGGDTLWVNMEAAYEGLDDATRFTHFRHDRHPRLAQADPGRAKPGRVRRSHPTT
jgi:alpha-ketoglutarate-dependent taurine dioxygenase